jgi:hypothetical protein
MRQTDIDELIKQADNFHNSKPINERKKLCISSAATQIQTLRQMKQKIKDSTEKQLEEIDSWIYGVASCLKQNLKDVESEVKR